MRAHHLTLTVTLSLIVAACNREPRLEPGTWTGTIRPPDQMPVTATFDVREARDSTGITLKAAGHEVPFTDIRVEPGHLRFTFSPGGNRIRCDLLQHDDGSYSGDCPDSRGIKGTIVMKPPTS